MSLSHRYIVMVKGFCGTLSFGFIFYYHYYVFSLTLMVFCFSLLGFFLDLFPLLFHVCIFVLLRSCLFRSCLVLVFVCQCTCLLFISTSTSYFGGSRSFCFSFVIVLHAFTCVKLHSQLCSAPVSHSLLALIVTNTVYGPSCALQKEVLVIHRWFLCLFLLMLLFFYWFLKARLLLEQFSLHPTFGSSPLHSTHLL